MSNNIYDILKKMQNLEAPKQNLNESKKAKPDYIDIDKDGDKKEPMKKAAHEKNKGAVAEAVAVVEQQLSEKYMGFKKTVAAVKKGGSAENPEAVAAAIGRKKYGKEKFQKAAAAGKKLGEGSKDNIYVRGIPDQGIVGSGKPDPQERKNWLDYKNPYRDTEGTFYDQRGNPRSNLELKKQMDIGRDYPVYEPGLPPDRKVPGDKSVSRQIAPRSLTKAVSSNKDPYDSGYPDQGIVGSGKPDPNEFKQWINREKPYRDDAGTFYDQQGNPRSNLELKKQIDIGRDYPVYEPGLPPDRKEPGKMKEGDMDESALQAHIGRKKYGPKGMKALQNAGRAGASKEEMAKIRAQHDKMDEDGTVPPKHYGGTGPTGAAFDLYMAKRKEQLAAQKPKNEDMLSAKQKSFAALAEPKDEITYADKIAGAKKGVKKEGNKFTAGLANDDVKVGEKIPGTNAIKTKDIDEGQADGPEYQAAWKRTQDERKAWEKSNPDKKYYDQGPADRHSMELSKARDADRAAKDATRGPIGRIANTLSRGLFGQELPEGRTSMREGWEEMQKYLEKKRGPESKGGAGKKAGTRYGGSAQKDDDEETDGEGQAVVKKKGRPKGTGGGAKFSFKKPKD
jgi:hypothetical protein